ncbi:hypothetical protein SporoP8_03435 [Sporosarcina ureae]|uniref:ImmA/IrrE family metallo-endopeptidase n=1 Tax=Sporosarcina ureae TaxID=1571 RepID=UPI000A16360A|nr:ImmA/IrrE family metallo-endopeptidase [Sporosarcina ureae]ARJ38028.1 hypothetical protein SporoP8_03435 [Sporosarcina ureae]
MGNDNVKKGKLKAATEETFLKFKESFPGIIEMPMKNSISKIESLGIFVLISAAPLEVSGFCMTIGEDTFIFVNKNHVLGRQNFSLWHEVYHWFTESTGSVSIVNEQENSEIEYQADYFASLVLLDKNHLSEKLWEMGIRNSNNAKYISYDHIIKLQHYFQVSYSSMVRKIIEIYPNSNLSSRYALGIPARQDELIRKTLDLNLSVNLIQPSKNTYISRELFILLEKLHSENKISKSKVFSIMDFIEKELS